MNVERREGLSLSRHQVHDLSKLTLPDELMFSELVGRRRDRRPSTVYIVRDEHGVVCGWAHIWASAGKYDLHVFVKDSHRQRGYGRAMAERAVAECDGVVRTFPRDDGGRQFYSSIEGLTCRPDRGKVPA